MKTLNMFLVLCTLTITACGGGMPDANPAADEPSSAATPQSSPVAEDESIPRDRAILVLPFAGSEGATPSGQAGGAAGGAAEPSGNTHHMK